MYLALFAAIFASPNYQAHILEELKSGGENLSVNSEEFLTRLLALKIPTKTDFSKLNK